MKLSFRITLFALLLNTAAISQSRISIEDVGLIFSRYNLHTSVCKEPLKLVNGGVLIGSSINDRLHLQSGLILKTYGVCYENAGYYFHVPVTILLKLFNTIDLKPGIGVSYQIYKNENLRFDYSKFLYDLKLALGYSYNLPKGIVLFTDVDIHYGGNIFKNSPSFFSSSHAYAELGVSIGVKKKLPF